MTKPFKRKIWLPIQPGDPIEDATEDLRNAECLCLYFNKDRYHALETGNDGWSYNKWLDMTQFEVIIRPVRKQQKGERK